MPALVRTLFLFCILAQSSAYAADARVRFEVDIKTERGKALEGAKVEVYHDGVMESVYFSTVRGVVFDKPLKGIYLLKISYPGMITKMAEIDCKVIDGKADLPITYCLMECELFVPNCPEKFRFLQEEPMIKFYLDKEEYFDYDEVYTTTQLVRIKNLKNESCKDSAEPQVPKNLADQERIRLEAAIIAPVVILTSLANNTEEEDRVSAGPKEKTKGKSFRLKYFKRDLHASSVVKM